MTLGKLIWSIAIGFFLGSHIGLAATTTRVSVDSEGNEADASSGLAALSADGRFVAFGSFASDLVPDDAFGGIFVHDRQTGTTTRVSVDSEGDAANLISESPAINADGRFVAFRSFADNLVPDDTNDIDDIFVHDRQTGTTTRVSVDSDGNEANSSNFRPNRTRPAISADGRFVAFDSLANNLVPDDTNKIDDIFIHDRQTGTTTRVSVDSEGNEGNAASDFPAISADGRFVAFFSGADNLVPDDTNRSEDTFVHDRQTSTTTRVSVDSNGNEGNSFSGGPAISVDGRFVAFLSGADNLVPDDTNNIKDVFVHDRQTGTTTRVSVDSNGNEGNGFILVPAISANGRFVAFTSHANNLVPDDTNGAEDCFVHDRQTGETTRASVNSLGQEGNNLGGGNGVTGCFSISADGRFVVFTSDASNLVPNDTNEGGDVFVADRDRDIVNGRVSLAPQAGSFRLGLKARDCADGFVGQLSFNARLENTGDAELTDLHMPISRLTGGNKLRTESGLVGPNGEFPVAERDDFADGILGPGESVTMPLEVCLRGRRPFKLFVDVADDRKTRVDDSATTQADFRFIIGLDRDDTLKGTNGDDMLIGFDGNDNMNGKKGDDLLLGGRGNDDISGGKGDDEIRGERGQDTLEGDGGDDLILGGAENDKLRGGRGDDELRGQKGNDKLRGDDDDDLLVGGSGNDALDGGRNIDICKGGSGKNTFRRCEL